MKCDFVKDQITDMYYDFNHLESNFRERLYKYQCLSELESLKDFQFQNLNDERVAIVSKNENLRKIVDLLELEASDIQNDNRFMFEKYSVGKEVQENLNVYEQELIKKQENLNFEVETLKKLVQEKQNVINSKKFNSLEEKELQLKQVENNIDIKMKEKIDYQSKIHYLQSEISKKMELLTNEKLQLEKIEQTNQLYDTSIQNANYSLKETDIEVEKQNKDALLLKNDIIKNSINYEELKYQIEILLKKVSTINKNNLSMSNFLQQAVNSLEEKKNMISKRNEKLDSAEYFKQKVINNLKEISTMKKYLELNIKADILPNENTSNPLDINNSNNLNTSNINFEKEN